jgi:hypothetical protein
MVCSAGKYQLANRGKVRNQCGLEIHEFYRALQRVLVLYVRCLEEITDKFDCTEKYVDINVLLIVNRNTSVQ